MKHLSILGSTGSIGTQALDVAAAHPEEFAVEALAARRSGTKLEEQARRFRPKLVVLQDEEEAAQLKKRLADTAIRVEAGEEGVLACAALEDCSMPWWASPACGPQWRRWKRAIRWRWPTRRAWCAPAGW